MSSAASARRLLGGFQRGAESVAKPLDFRVVERIQYHAAPDFRAQQPHLAQGIHMTRTGGLRKRQGIHNLHARTLAALVQKRDDRNPRRMRQRFRELRQRYDLRGKRVEFGKRHISYLKYEI